MSNSTSYARDFELPSSRYARVSTGSYPKEAYPKKLISTITKMTQKASVVQNLNGPNRDSKHITQKTLGEAFESYKSTMASLRNSHQYTPFLLLQKPVISCARGVDVVLLQESSSEIFMVFTNRRVFRGTGQNDIMIGVESRQTQCIFRYEKRPWRNLDRFCN